MLQLFVKLFFVLVVLILYIILDLNYKLKPQNRVLNFLTSEQDKKYDIMHVKGVAIHHSATAIRSRKTGRKIGVQYIDRMHEFRSFRRFKYGKVYHIGYHYVIPFDGKLERGRPEHYPGAHVMGSPNYAYLGVCLIGFFCKGVHADNYFMIKKPTERQIKTLTRLLRKLQVKHAIPLSQIKRHKDFSDDTVCPGNNFGWESFMAAYKKRLLEAAL